MHFNLNISGYEGPLDLLLDLSKKQKVDIKKISILELANQYLDFINKNLENLKLSADYLVMASFLAFLKYIKHLQALHPCIYFNTIFNKSTHPIRSVSRSISNITLLIAFV